MNKNTCLLIAFISCFFYFGKAQTILLEGHVTNPDDVENIHVLNKTSRYNAITNQEGKFSIEVNRYDTLVFSGIKYFPKKVVVSDSYYAQKHLSVALVVLLNELDEVVLGNTLSGDLLKDVENIKTEEVFNFDDVGIPGFKGEPEEKIPDLLGQTITPLSVDLESLYKHMTGYYKKLKMVRHWLAQDITVAEILHIYRPSFFMEAYGIPENRTYDFVLHCVETTQIEKELEIKNHIGILSVFDAKAPEYLSEVTILKDE